MRLAPLILTVIFFTHSVFAAELKSSDDAVALTDKAMQLFTSGDFREGVNLLRPYTTAQKADLDSLVAQAEINMPTMIERYGKSLDYELLQNDTVGGSLIRVVYLQRLEKHAVVWRFILYHGSNGWVINNFIFADDITAAF